METPEIRFADANGVNIAWVQWGQGPDVLTVPPFVSNVEIVWEHELYRRFLEYLGRYVRVTAFDKRGMGLSDKFFEPPTLEQRTEDILAVMDAAGLVRPSLYGESEGGLIAQLFAANHPQRVDRLVLMHAHPGMSGFLAVHRGPDGNLDSFDRFVARMEHIYSNWGTEPQHLVDFFSPCHSANAAYVRWMGRLQRQSATVADVRRQVASVRILDAADRLGDIKAPTLVIQSDKDPIVPLAAGRYLAERIPGARFFEYESADHFPGTSPHWQQVCDTWIEFVTGVRPTHNLVRRAATVLFTDIVDSTVRTFAAGDDRWRHTLDQHDRIAWALADRHHGTIVKTTGDGLLARFDAPSQALEYATDLRRDLRDLGLPIRCGLHAGEIELRDNGDITGTAVNLAARVEQAAGAGDIFVSSTVRDMLLGSEYRFEDRGEHQLKGLDEPRRLFALSAPEPLNIGR